MLNASILIAENNVLTVDKAEGLPLVTLMTENEFIFVSCKSVRMSDASHKHRRPVTIFHIDEL